MFFLFIAATLPAMIAAGIVEALTDSQSLAMIVAIPIAGLGGWWLADLLEDLL